MRYRLVVAATRRRALGDRCCRQLGDPSVDGLCRRRYAGRPAATDIGALRVRLHSRPAFRTGCGWRARRSVRLAQGLFRARRPVRTGGGRSHLRTHRRSANTQSRPPRSEPARLQGRLCSALFQSLCAHDPHRGLYRRRAGMGGVRLYRRKFAPAFRFELHPRRSHRGVLRRRRLDLFRAGPAIGLPAWADRSHRHRRFLDLRCVHGPRIPAGMVVCAARCDHRLGSASTCSTTPCRPKPRR